MKPATPLPPPGPPSGRPSVPSPAPSAARRRAAALCLLALGTAHAAAAGTAAPADGQRLRTRALAATCAQCHGTDGQAVAGQAMVRLAGQPKDYLLTQLLAFRSGQRPASVMHQISRGYTAEQLDEVAGYFAAQK